MRSILFQLGPITIFSYGTILAVSFVICLSLMISQRNRVGMSTQQVYDMAVWTIIGGLLGARLTYVIMHWDEFSKNLVEIVMIHRGGLAFFGSYIGGAAALILFLKRHRLPFLKFADFFSPFVALGHAVGRLGCFMNGCCYGRPTECPWGVTFPAGSLPASHFGLNHRIHPTQLYEFSLLIILFLILHRMDQRKKFDGQTFSLYLILYSLIRFLMEFLRGDARYVIPGWLTVFQSFCLVFMVLGVTIYLLKSRPHVGERSS